MKAIKCVLPILIMLASHADANSDLKDDESLYDLAPTDAAYVRLVNVTSAPIKLNVGDQTLTANEFCSTSGIIWVKPETEISGVFSTITTVTGELYTVVISDSSSVMSERMSHDPFKANLGTYNLTNEVISLVTTTGHRPVFSDLSAGMVATRPLNPITVALTTLVADMTASLGQISLKRGKKTDTFICEAGREIAFGISEY